MRLLLDTHALIWALAAPRRLPRRVKVALADRAHFVAVSSASTWEIAIKAALGKIDARLDEIAAAVHDTGFHELPVTIAHTQRVLGLAALHRDPFDRILVAQALEEGLTVVTHDLIFARYPAPILWD